MSPEVERLSGIWTPLTFRSPGLRKFGVPPGGLWNASLEAIYLALGEPLLSGEAAAPGAGSVLKLKPKASCTWLILGSEGRLTQGREEAAVPALLVGEETAELISESGGRWTIAAYPSSASPLLKSLQMATESQDSSIRIISLPEHKKLLEKGEWMVSPHSSRVGLRLIGPAPNLCPLASSRPSSPGVLQAPGMGELLVHGPAGPTSGGYPALGSVIRADLGRLAELPPGANIRFRPVSRNEALAAWQERIQAADQTAAALNKLKRLGLV